MRTGRYGLMIGMAIAMGFLAILPRHAAAQSGAIRETTAPSSQGGVGIDRGSGRAGFVELPATGSLFVTVAVPAAETGAAVRDTESAFETKEIRPQNGKVRIELSATPVLIEEAIATGRSSPVAAKEAPFGIAYNGFLKDPSIAVPAMKELGARIGRFYGPHGGLLWDLVEPTKGTYDWSKNDLLYGMAQRAGLDIMVNIYAMNRWDQPDMRTVTLPKSHLTRLPARYPTDIDSYKAFVRAAAERYDGDGVNDAPGSPNIRWWIIGAEMGSNSRWQDTPENYAKLFLDSYLAIKSSYPQAQVLLFGENVEMAERKDRVDTFMKPVLREVKRLGATVPNFSFIFGLHHYNPAPAVMKKNIAFCRNMLKDMGLASVPVWILDSATFATGADAGNAPRTERQLAADVVRFHGTALGNGIPVFVWANLSDSYQGSQNTESGFFSKPGGRREKTHSRKLSFYSYQLLTQRLGGADWKAARIIHEGENGTYVYGFPCGDGGMKYVAWRDNVF